MNSTITTFEFNYTQFKSLDLQHQAQQSLTNLVAYVRTTFSGLVENGRQMWDVYYQCCAELGCKEGKKVFADWLSSNDFGASRYVAKAAMDISLWFDKLPKRVQQLLVRNVQKWSVSALKELTKVSSHLVAELAKSGKKQTVQSIRQARLKVGDSAEVLADVQGYKGQVGIVLSQPDENSKVWVEMPDGQEVQLGLGELRKARKPRPEQEVFTKDQLEEKVAAAVSEAIADFQEQQQVTAELQKQLEEKERQLTQVQAQLKENESLQQRVAELEKALQGVQQASEPVKSEEATPEVVKQNKQLQKEVKALQAQAKAQTKELERLRQQVVKTEPSGEDVASGFGEVAESLGLTGWDSRGYRSSDGQRYRGLAAIKAFIRDTREGLNSTQDMEWAS